MLYQEYKNKVSKFIRILEKISKYKVLIISVASIIAVMLTGFLATKGIILNSSISADTFVYGDDIGVNAGALFSGVEYEYSVEGDDTWTTVRPVSVGKYKVRAVSWGSFGTKRYSGEFAFSIVPKTINVEVQEEAIVYGNTPNVKTDSIVTGDFISCDEFVYGDRTQNVSIVYPKKESIIIKNSDGNDVTSSYNIVIKTDDAISFVKRPITITIDSASGAYDGAELKAEDYSVSEQTPLAFDDKIKAEKYPSQTGVGTIINSPSELFVITSPDGNDVTVNYEITVIKGSITVTPRPVIIHTGSATFEFDDKEHTVTDYEVDSKTPLVNGHRISVNTSTSVRYFSTVENVMEISILDENGNDVTKNYQIQFENGTIEITKKKISVTTVTDHWIYDGISHENSGYLLDNANELIDGHIINALSSTQVLEATGSAVNNVVVFEIISGDKDVTDCYDIEYNYGTLEVLKRDLSIKSDDELHTYDGEIFKGSGYQIVSGSLAPEQIIEASFVVELIDVESTENKFTALIMHNGKDVTENYNFEISYGTLEVVKRPINIAGKGCERIYDGTELSLEEYVLLSELDVLSKHTVKYLQKGKITNVGSTDNAIEIAIFEGDEEKTYNYAITYESPFKLTVLHREITITAGSIIEIYDGTARSCNTYTISDPQIAPNQKEAVTISGFRKNVGVSDNIITNVEITDANGESVIENYIVNIVNGSLVIEPRPITVISGDNEKYYDGYEITKHEAYVSDTEGMGLAPQQEITYSYTGSRVDAGESPNIFTVQIWADSEETTSNYDISLIYGTLTVHRRPITLISSDDEKIYDGKVLVKHEAYVSDTEGMGLAPNQEATYEFTGSQLDAGSSYNYFEAQIWLGGTETTYNYDITYKYGTLLVNKRPILVVSGSDSKVYDGLELSCIDAYVSTAEGKYPLVSGHYLNIATYTEIINASKADNEITVLIIDEHYNDKTNNYDIQYSYGTLEIIKRDITINTASDVKMYDGTQLTNNSYTIDSGVDCGLAYGKNGQIISVIINGSITFKGSVKNAIASVEIYDGEEKVTDNYNVIKNEGTLEITPRPITITADDKTKEYDARELTGSTVTVGGYGLASTDFIIATFSGSRLKPGSSPVNVESWIIYNGEEDASDSYELLGLYEGTLTVTPREIIIIASSESKFYDAEPLIKDGYSSIGGSGLVRGHKIGSVSVEGSIINVGTCDNVLSNATILDDNGNDVTDYYNISYENGTLEILPRPIAVITGSSEKTYDQTPLTNSEGYVDQKKEMGLVSGHSATVTATGIGIDAGEYENTFTIVITSGGEDVTGNYDPIPYTGILKINPLDLYFKTEGAEAVYTGEALTNDNYSYISGAVLDGHRISYAHTTGKQQQAGESNNTLEVIILDPNDNDVSHNYKINVEYGILKVTKRPIRVTTGSASKVYDGTPLTCNIAGFEELDLSLPPLLNGHTIEIVATGAITEIGKTDNTFEVRATFSEQDVSECFEVIESELGTLEVTPSPLVFESVSDTKEYDGTKLEANFASLVSGSLAKGHDVQFSFTGEIINASTAENVFTVKIFDIETGEEITDYYPSIECIYGTLEITPKALTIKASSAVKEYDGTPLYSPLEVLDQYQSLQDLNLIFNKDRFTWRVLESSAQLTEVGELKYTINPSHFQIYFDGEAVPMTNFDITCEEGTLRVVENLVIINLWELQKYYDGTPLSYEHNYWYLEENPYGLTIEFNLFGSLTEAGSLDNDELLELCKDRIIIYKDGVDVTEQYDVAFAGAPLTVNKRFVELTVASAQKVYDGKPLEAHSYTISKGSLVEGHYIDPQSIVYFDSQTNVGLSPNTIMERYIRILDRYGNDVTENYFVSTVDGVLEVIEEDK